jgi:hypothetical protein
MSGAAFNRLGPRAQGALRRATETAMTAAAGRRPAAADLDRQFRYALALIETAMILDAAEAEAAAQDPHA